MEIFTDILIQCCGNCIPHRTIKFIPREKSGMTSLVKSLLNKSRRLHKRERRSNNPLDKIRHREVRRIAKSHWKTAGKNFYDKITLKLNEETSNS